MESICWIWAWLIYKLAFGNQNNNLCVWSWKNHTHCQTYTHCHTYIYLITLTRFLGNHMPNFNLVYPIISFWRQTTSCGCGYNQTIPNLVNNAYPGIWRPQVKFRSDLSFNWLLVAKTTSCVCVVMTKPHPLPTYMQLLTFTLLLEDHMPNFVLFCRRVWPWWLDTHANKYICLLTACTWHCSANDDIKDYRSHSNFCLISPLISFCHTQNFMWVWLT